jgi:hypothetical protein
MGAGFAKISYIQPTQIISITAKIAHKTVLLQEKSNKNILYVENFIPLRLF